MQKSVALLYARLSNTRDTSEPSIEAQVTDGLAFIQQRGYTCNPTDIYIEPAGKRSGASLKQRPAMRRVIARLEQDDTIAAFVCRDFARASRDTEFSLQFTALLKQHEVEFLTFREGDIRTGTATDNLMTTSRAMVNQFYRDKVRDDTRGWFMVAKRNGWNIHRRGPLGLNPVGHEGERHFEPTQDLETATLIITLLARGVSYFAIARELRALGKMGRSIRLEPTPIQPYHVKQIARGLESYRGFIDDAALNEAIRRQDERARHVWNGKRPSPPVLVLWRLLTCADCGRRWFTIKKKSGALYRHSPHSICANRRAVGRGKVELQVWTMLDRLSQYICDHPDELASLLQNRLPAISQHQRRQALERKLDNLERAYIAEEIRKESYLPLKREFENELAELHAPEPEPVTLTVEDLRQVFAVTDWEQMARIDPLAVNAVLRDYFERITIDRDNHLEFVPRENVRQLFEQAISGG